MEEAGLNAAAAALICGASGCPGSLEAQVIWIWLNVQHHLILSISSKVAGISAERPLHLCPQPKLHTHLRMLLVVISGIFSGSASAPPPHTLIDSIVFLPLPRRQLSTMVTATLPAPTCRATVMPCDTNGSLCSPLLGALSFLSRY